MNGASTPLWDVLVVGGGPAGLNAAQVLGRARRRVFLCDTGEPDHLAAEAVHGMLSRDGTPPSELRRLGAEELRRYPSVSVSQAKVEVVDRAGDGRFTAKVEAAGSVETRRVLLAYGIRNSLPNLEGIEELWGKSVIDCPFCHGWEVREAAIAVYGPGATPPLRQALLLTAWADDLVLLSDGEKVLGDEELRRLQAAGVRVDERRVAGLRRDQGQLTAIRFADGSELARDALFIRPKITPASDLGSRLGCDFLDPETVQVDEKGATTVRGVYAAGDLCLSVSSVVIAAAHGARTAAAIVKDLVDEDTR